MKELVVQEGYVFKEETHLTILKTSLFFSGDGFAAYDCKGQLVFRFDSYGPNTKDKDELVVMDPQGASLLTLRKKVPYPPNHLSSFFSFNFLVCLSPLILHHFRSILQKIPYFS